MFPMMDYFPFKASVPTNLIMVVSVVGSVDLESIVSKFVQFFSFYRLVTTTGIVDYSLLADGPSAVQLYWKRYRKTEK